MSDCVQCGSFPRNKLTNIAIRRSDEACAKEYFLDPATMPLLDTTAYPSLEPYNRHKGALVGYDATTGYLRPSWLYTDPTVFMNEFIGVMDYSLEPLEADCKPSPRKCGGKVVVYSGCGALVEMELLNPTEAWTGHEVVAVLDPTGSFVHPFLVDVVVGATPSIGTVDCGQPGRTIDMVTFNLN